MSKFGEVEDRYKGTSREMERALELDQQRLDALQPQPVTFASLLFMLGQWARNFPTDLSNGQVIPNLAIQREALTRVQMQLESLERQVKAGIDELTAVANGLTHDQSEDPDQGMIPTISCAHCQLLLTAIPILKKLLGEGHEGREPHPMGEAGAERKEQ